MIPDLTEHITTRGLFMYGTLSLQFFSTNQHTLTRPKTSVGGTTFVLGRKSTPLNRVHYITWWHGAERVGAGGG